MHRLTHLGRKIRLFVAKGPAHHYTYGRWRLIRWLNSESINIATLSEQDLLAQLDLEKPELNPIRQAAAEGNYDTVRTSLRTYFQTRTAPRFFFDPGDISQITSFINSHHKQITLKAADQLCQNVFCFRQATPVRFRDGINWAYSPNNNIEWTWDLNRHAYFGTLGRAYSYTGDERYARKFRELLFDWLVNNPAGVEQPSWTHVFEVAFRINTWIWAFFYFCAATAFDNDTCLALLKGLLAHGRYLDAHLELHAPNNHLLLEAKSLAMLGLVFPEFKLAEKWRHRGLRILYQQIRAQVCSDGVHGERTTFYHQVIASELLELLILLDNNQISVPADITGLFSRMVEFELWTTKPDGKLPLLSDSSLEDTYPRFSAASGGPAFLGRSDLKSIAPPFDEGSVWLLGHRRVRQHLDAPATNSPLNSRAFPEGGYFVMRDGQKPESPFLVFDAGPFGLKSMPGHGHADALNFELYACGRTMLVDPGFFGRMRLGKDWRNFFRSSRAHNTVVVDDQDQSVLIDTWRVYRPAQTTLHQWFSSLHFDWVDASHDGYKRLAKPITHRRQVLFVKPEYWIVIDVLTGQGTHCFDLYFHLMPDHNVQIEPSSGSACAQNGLGPKLMIVPLPIMDLQATVFTGATRPIQGWVAFFSGEKLPAPTLRYRRVSAVPTQFCTVLYPCPAGENVSIAAFPLDVKTEAGHRLGIENGLTGLRIETTCHTDYLVVDRRSTQGWKVFDAYMTDARFLYLRRQKDDNSLVKVMMRGSGQLLIHGQPFTQTPDLAEGFIFDSGEQTSDSEQVKSGLG